MRREDLQRIRTLNNDIADGCEWFAVIKSKAFPGAIRYDDIGGSKPTPTNKMEDVFARLDQVDQTINKFIDERHDLSEKAVKIIQSAIAPEDMRERHILYLRYLARDSRTGRPLQWDTVVYLVNKYHNIGRRKIFDLHHIAVNKIEKYNM